MRLLFVALALAASASAQPEIPFDQFRDGTLAGTSDRYRFWADEGDVIEVHVEATFDPIVDVVDPSGMIVATDDDGGDGLWSHVRQHVVGASGTHLVAVRSFLDAGRGPYTVIVRRLGRRGPQACDDSALPDDALAVGDRVVIGRHRPVGGDDNWAEAMSPYVGREASVRSIASTDDAGCPTVTLTLDGGAYYWRVRDLTVLTGAPLSVQACGLSLPVDFGSVHVGSEIVLGRHRAVDGEDNWASTMNDYVGRTATVTRLVGTERPSDCGIVRVSIDEGEYQWRIRDALPRMGRHATPQACGQTAPIDHGPVEIGTVVWLGRHRPVNGDANWADDMDTYVGRRTTVAEIRGTDDEGCPTVRVAADGGAFSWRVRDLSVEAPGAGLPQACESAVPDYGTVGVGTQVRLGRHRAVATSDNWADEMDDYVGTQTRVRSLEGVDGSNCAVVRVEADNGAYYWRVRDLTLAE